MPKRTESSGKCGLIKVLEAIDAEWEPVEEIFRRDHVWSVHVYGWIYRLKKALEWLSGGTNSEEQIELAFRATVQRRNALHRLLMAELAIRAYQLEEAKNPHRLENLVPQYLTKIPEDPYSSQPLIYRRLKDKYLLYSVGPNERDDGGELVTWEQLLGNNVEGNKGDLFLDIVFESDSQPSSDDADADGEGEQSTTTEE